MQVVAFAAAFRAVQDETGGLKTEGFPMTSCHVDAFPKQITVPIVLSVYTESGAEYDPRLYIMVNSPEGKRLGVLECTWHWPDKPGVPVKFWVLSRHLAMVVAAPGVYSVGLYDSLHATEPEHVFPLPVVQFNPLLPPRP
jgi:hypothetical protein